MAQTPKEPSGILRDDLKFCQKCFSDLEWDFGEGAEGCYLMQGRKPKEGADTFYPHRVTVSRGLTNNGRRETVYKVRIYLGTSPTDYICFEGADDILSHAINKAKRDAASVYSFLLENIKLGGF